MMKLPEFKIACVACGRMFYENGTLIDPRFVKFPMLERIVDRTEDELSGSGSRAPT